MYSIEQIRFTHSWTTFDHWQSLLNQHLVFLPSYQLSKIDFITSQLYIKLFGMALLTLLVEAFYRRFFVEKKSLDLDN